MRKEGPNENKRPWKTLVRKSMLAEKVQLRLEGLFSREDPTKKRRSEKNEASWHVPHLLTKLN
jgi:hypothetical protein